MTPKQLAARRRAIRRHREAWGWTYQRIADKFGVTRQRVWTICNKQDG